MKIAQFFVDRPILAGVLPINFLAEMTSIGTLAAFLVVSTAVLVLRRREPGLERKFRIPFGPVIPILSIIGCLWIIKDLRPVTVIVFALWTAAFLLWYVLVARKNSVIGKRIAAGELIPAGHGKYREPETVPAQDGSTEVVENR